MPQKTEMIICKLQLSESFLEFLFGPEYVCEKGACVTATKVNLLLLPLACNIFIGQTL